MADAILIILIFLSPIVSMILLIVFYCKTSKKLTEIYEVLSVLNDKCK